MFLKSSDTIFNWTITLKKYREMSFSSEPGSGPASITLPRQDTSTTMSSFATSLSNLDTNESLSNASSLRRQKPKLDQNKKRKSSEHFAAFGDEKTLRTLKVHYYPEGNWGWFVLFVGVLVQIFNHGLHVSFGMFLVKLENVFGVTQFSGKNSCWWLLQRPSCQTEIICG